MTMRNFYMEFTCRDCGFKGTEWEITRFIDWDRNGNRFLIPACPRCSSENMDRAPVLLPEFI